MLRIFICRNNLLLLLLYYDIIKIKYFTTVQIARCSNMSLV